MMSVNYTDVNTNVTNGTMFVDKSVNTVCDGLEKNTSVCDTQGLGVSLATPIAMFSSGVVGNMIALIVLYTARVRMKKTLFYILLCALAWTDLICLLLVSPIAVIVYANNLHWVGGEPVCKYHGFFMTLTSLITPMIVCLLSIERVLAITFPYFHERVLTKTKIFITLGCLWAFVITFSCMPFVGFGSYAHQFPGSWCFLNFHKETPSDTAYATTYSVINVITISTILVMNAIVMGTLIKMRRRKLGTSPSLERRAAGKGRPKLKVEQETKMMWFLGTITLVFVTCWFPLTIHILINQTTGRINYRADLIGVRLASINQILDPWVYILLRKSVIVKLVKYVKNFLTSEFSSHNKTLKHSSKYVTNFDRSNHITMKNSPVYHDVDRSDSSSDTGDVSDKLGVDLPRALHVQSSTVTEKDEMVALSNGDCSVNGDTQTSRQCNGSPLKARCTSNSDNSSNSSSSESDEPSERV